MNLALRNSALSNYRASSGTFAGARPGRMRAHAPTRSSYAPVSSTFLRSALASPAKTRLNPNSPALVPSPQPVKLRKVALQPRRISSGKIGALAITMVVVSFLAQLFISTVSAQLSFARVEVEQKISLLTQDLQQVELNIARNQANIATLVKKYGLAYAENYLVIDLGD